MTRETQSWAAVLTGPVAWFASLMVNLALSGAVCSQGWKMPMFAVTAAALLLTASAGMFAWRLWRQAGAELPGESGGLTAQLRALALAGVLLSSMFLVVILAQSIPNFLFGGCE